MNLDKLRAKLPTKFTVTINQISYDDELSGHTYKLNIYDGTTPKYIGLIKGGSLTTTYDVGYEVCVKEWFSGV